MRLIVLDLRIRYVNLGLSLLLTKFRKEAEKRIRIIWALKDMWSQ